MEKHVKLIDLRWAKVGPKTYSGWQFARKCPKILINTQENPKGFFRLHARALTDRMWVRHIGPSIEPETRNDRKKTCQPRTMEKPSGFGVSRYIHI